MHAAEFFTGIKLFPQGQLLVNVPILAIFLTVSMNAFGNCIGWTSYSRVREVDATARRKVVAWK
jgi:hypothetical protein